MERGNGIGRRAEADIPDDKFPGIIFQPLANLELADVKQFRLRLRAEAGVHFLAISGREQRSRAIGKLDKLVVAGHKELINRETCTENCQFAAGLSVRDLKLIGCQPAFTGFTAMVYLPGAADFQSASQIDAAEFCVVTGVGRGAGNFLVAQHNFKLPAPSEAISAATWNFPGRSTLKDQLAKSSGLVQ